MFLNSSFGGLKFGTDGDGNYGYYGADGSLIPFSSRLVFSKLTRKSITLSSRILALNGNVDIGFSGDTSKIVIVTAYLIRNFNSNVKIAGTTLFDKDGGHTLMTHGNGNIQFSISNGKLYIKQSTFYDDEGFSGTIDVYSVS